MVIRQEKKKINKRGPMAIVLTHERFKNMNEEFQEMHIVPRYCRILEKGDPRYFFDSTRIAQTNPEEDNVSAILPVEIRRLLEHKETMDLEEIAIAKGLLEENDDNEPAPENTP